MVELDFFQIFLPYSFRLIGPQTKHSQIQPWWVKIGLKELETEQGEDGGGGADGGGLYQREGMGLPEYQGMPSLRDIAHDGWLCTFTI